jgi:hypothetical protein
MTARRVGKRRSARAHVSWFHDVIRLRDVDLFGAQLGEIYTVFLRRVFALREVFAVEIDRSQGTADICYRRSG